MPVLPPGAPPSAEVAAEVDAAATLHAARMHAQAVASKTAKDAEKMDLHLTGRCARLPDPSGAIKEVGPCVSVGRCLHIPDMQCFRHEEAA